MSEGRFDQEWQIGELLDAEQLRQLGVAMQALVGEDLALLDARGRALHGQPAPAARREPVVLELEPVAWLASATASPGQLQGLRQLVQAVLRAQIRYKMASTLHLEAVAEDFETLKREHARLLESEARYKALSEQLEARVQAQVRQLEERQQMLYEAEKLASVGQLAAGMAHEINNPLGFVRSNLATFRSYLDSIAQLHARLGEGEAAWRALDLDFILEDSVDLLKDSQAGIERIARIVSDLKAFSNVDRASEEYTDINSCLRQVIEVVGRQLPPGITLAPELGTVPAIVCLPGHLNQLFFALLRNAVQAIQDAGRPGTIRILSQADHEGLHVSICDDGVGMNGQQLEHAFEPFYTTRPVGQGAGLGLSTAYNIAQAHSGRLELQSTPGAGTSVTLHLPLPASRPAAT